MKLKHKQYAVYDNDENIVMIGNSVQCAEYMGMTKNTFKSHISRLKNGKIKKGLHYTAYEIEDDEE